MNFMSIQRIYILKVWMILNKNYKTWKFIQEIIKKNQKVFIIEKN